MSKRSWGPADTIVTVTAVLIASAFWSFFIWELSARNTQYDQDADHYAAEYADKAQKDMREACPGGNVQNVAECVADYQQAQRDTYRNEHDLKAQQKMADWALGMLIASSVTLAATVPGVYLVWLNLKEARTTTAEAIRANKIAKAYADIDARPWLLIKNATIKEITVRNKYAVRVKFTVVYENSGRTPALNIGQNHFATDPNQFRTANALVINSVHTLSHPTPAGFSIAPSAEEETQLSAVVAADERGDRGQIATWDKVMIHVAVGYGGTGVEKHAVTHVEYNLADATAKERGDTVWLSLSDIIKGEAKVCLLRVGGHMT